MPSRPAHPCAEPGCRVLVRGGSRCPRHQQQLDERRGSRHERGYTNDWYRIAQQTIAEQPWCSDMDEPWCRWSGRREDLTADHIVPLARGGTNTRENARTLCRGCNSRKGARG